MLVKLEGFQGQALDTLEIEMPASPPEVLLLGQRVFRFARTDGVWDRKSHVYREASPLKAGRQVTRKFNQGQKQQGKAAAPNLGAVG